MAGGQPCGSRCRAPCHCSCLTWPWRLPWGWASSHARRRPAAWGVTVATVLVTGLVVRQLLVLRENLRLTAELGSGPRGP